MIKLTKICKIYGGEYLLRDVSWSMSYGDKIGLIGANGTGKTTQLKIISGQEEMDSGEVSIEPGIRISYLSQEPIVDPGNTLDEELLKVFAPVLEAEHSIKILQKELSTISDEATMNQKMDEIAKLQEYFDHNDGYTIHARIGQVISGLRFSEQDRERKISTFSGGWQMRISIAKLLLECPDLILLDEPTNHLDIKAAEWLEGYLSNYKGGYIIVSHDRQFLDKTVNRIIEMEKANANLYWGNYTKYIDLKEEQYEAQLAAYNHQQEKLVKEKAFINKFRASAARSSQAKSRERQIEKLELVEPPSRKKRVKFSFPVSVQSAEEVIKVTNAFKAYDEKIVLNEVSLEIRRKDKIALIGDNGSGKTTLLNIVMGLDTDFKGKVRTGQFVKQAYFNQHQARSLSGDRTVFEELHSAAPMYTNEQVRTTLARFGIKGDNVFKKLDNLSGGEKARLALSKMLMSGSNFLIFDEPTNHLDIPAKEALEQALSDFEGTVVVVSHDRAFIDNFATKVFEIEDTSVNTYIGNYSDYRYKKQRQGSRDVSPANTPEIVIKDQTAKQKANKDKKVSPKSVEKQLVRLENDILKLEDDILVMEAKLDDPNLYNRSPEEFNEIVEKLESSRIELDKLNEEWLALADSV